MRNRLLYALLVAGMFSAGLILPAAGHGREPRPGIEAKVTLERSDLGGVAAGSIATYGDDMLVHVRIRPAIPIVGDANAAEWSIELYDTANCTGPPVVLVATDPPAYGPRVWERIPAFGIGSVALSHEGPNFEGHAGHPGRHMIACATT